MELAVDLQVAQDASLETVWFVHNTLFVQTLRDLASTDTEYTYELEGEKVEVNTYSYNLKNGKVKELKDFNYVVDGYAYSNEKCAVLLVTPINDQKLGGVSYVQSFNNLQIQ